MANQDSYSLLESVIRQTFASVVWTHKIQEKQGDIKEKHFRGMETVNIFCASLTSTGVLSIAFGQDQAWIKVATALLSFVTVFFGAYFKSFKMQDNIAKHRVTAAKLVAIRNDLVALIADTRLGKEDPDTIQNEYKRLLSKLHSVYSEAPATTEKAVKLAEEALVVKQDYTFSDEEINRFLPRELHKEVV